MGKLGFRAFTGLDYAKTGQFQDAGAPLIQPDSTSLMTTVLVCSGRLGGASITSAKAGSFSAKSAKQDAKFFS